MSRGLPLLRLRSNHVRLLCLLALPGWPGVAGVVRQVAFVISRPAPHVRRFTIYRRAARPPACPTEGPWTA
jgi:hypothetical protein